MNHLRPGRAHKDTDNVEPTWLKAFLYGAFSAASLPLGAAMGVFLRPPARVIAAVMALGAGALVAALTLELVGPALEHAGFYPLAAGVALGCGAFVLLNALLDDQGAFLRSTATLVQHARKRKRSRLEAMVGVFSQADILRSLPPEELQAILPSVEEDCFPAGTTLFRQGEPGLALYIIAEGAVAIECLEGGRRIRISELGPGQTFGEMALLTGEARSADAVAIEPVRLWKIEKDNFDRLARSSPRLREAATELMVERKLTRADSIDPEEWRARVMEHLDPAALNPTPMEVQQAVDERAGKSVGLAIWLGACLDGIGEALVIGATTIGASVSLPLIGGVLLANLPESMSSAAAMSRQGMRFGRIFWLWVSLALVTGIASALGNALFAGAPAYVFAFFEGAAAGSMLAMTAQTMLPEAFEHGGGTAVGILTVAGFLAAIFVKSLAGPAGHSCLQ